MSSPRKLTRSQMTSVLSSLPETQVEHDSSTPLKRSSGKCTDTPLDEKLSPAAGQPQWQNPQNQQQQHPHPISTTADCPIDPSYSARQPVAEYSGSQTWDGGTSSGVVPGSIRGCQPMSDNEDAPGSPRGCQPVSDDEGALGSPRGCQPVSDDEGALGSPRGCQLVLDDEDAIGPPRVCQPVSDDKDAPGSSRGCQPVSDNSSELPEWSLSMQKLVSSGEDDAAEDDVDLATKKTFYNMDKAEPGVEKGYSNMLYGTTTELRKFVIRMVQERQLSGINTWDGLRPELDDDGVLHYGSGQYSMVETLQRRREEEGVFLCQDVSTEKFFVLKKMFTRDYILPGLRFLTLHEQRFLPKIYAVYKAENNMVSIFEEYIEGVTLARCDWTPEQILQFARCLLSACHYLHNNGLAHRDLKLANVMVRDPSKPDSLVIIDFESARVREWPSVHEGQGNTPAFLPPWHRDLPQDRFSPLQMAADLWALACILICLLESSTWLQKRLTQNHHHHHQHQLHQQEQRLQQQLQALGVNRRAVPEDQMRSIRSIWAQKMAEVVRNCRPPHKQPQKHAFCDRCREAFLHFLETKGEGEILEAHLGSLNAAWTEDPHWPSLKQLLEYLTNSSNSDHMSAATALAML